MTAAEPRPSRPEYDAAVKRVVAAAPPLSPHQRAVLRALLRPERPTGRPAA